MTFRENWTHSDYALPIALLVLCEIFLLINLAHIMRGEVLVIIVRVCVRVVCVSVTTLASATNALKARV